MASYNLASNKHQALARGNRIFAPAPAENVADITAAATAAVAAAAAGSMAGAGAGGRRGSAGATGGTKGGGSSGNVGGSKRGPLLDHTLAVLAATSVGLLRSPRHMTCS